jgi:hypothetical protein
MGQRALQATTRKPLGIKIVCLSDTHSHHRDLEVPDGDLLIHAGDFTIARSTSDPDDFFAWLAALPHKHKILVNGNHERNAKWSQETAVYAKKAGVIFLCDEAVTLDLNGRKVRVWGANFRWPIDSSSTESPYGAIPTGTDIIVSHGPAKGYVDEDSDRLYTGCEALLQAVRRVRPRLLVCGHIHSGRGIAHGAGDEAGTIFVNAANAGHRHTLAWPATVLEA